MPFADILIIQGPTRLPPCCLCSCRRPSKSVRTRQICPPGSGSVNR